MKLSPEQLLDELEKLLSSLKGVSVRSRRGNADCMVIEYTVTSPLSRLILNICAEGANVYQHSWAIGSTDSELARENPDNAICYQLKDPRMPDESADPIETFKRLGAHLTWEMYKAGQLSSSEEKRLCKLFEAVSRSA